MRPVNIEQNKEDVDEDVNRCLNKDEDAPISSSDIALRPPVSKFQIPPEEASEEATVTEPPTILQNINNNDSKVEPHIYFLTRANAVKNVS